MCVCLYLVYIRGRLILLYIYIRLAASRTLIGRPRPWASIYISVNVYIMSCESHNTYICISDYSL